MCETRFLSLLQSHDYHQHQYNPNITMHNLLGRAEVGQCDAKGSPVSHLEIWKPAVTIFDLRGSVGRWRLDQFLYKLSNSIHNLLEIVIYCFSGSPPCVVNPSKSLLMSKNMKKHCYLFLDTTVDAIF
jgi:hypothetical protein